MFEYHPLANIFDLLDGDDFQELTQDIKAHGLLDPITLLDGKILDGRNRYRACMDAGVEPNFTAYGEREVYEDFEYSIQYLGELENPGAYVISRNAKRRHLTASQRAMAGVKLKEYYAKIGKQKQAEQALKNQPQNTDKKDNSQKVVKVPPSEKSKARDQAGRDVGVSGSMIDRAEYVDKNAEPDIKDAVKKGELSVTSAYKQTKGESAPKKKKPSAVEKLRQQLEEANETISDLRDVNKELMDEVNSQANLSLPEQQQVIKLNQLREQIRALESQRDDLMMQVNQWKREALGLRKKLGMEQQYA